MYSTGDFALSPYLPYMMVPFYPLFQERGGERVERDQTDWDVRGGHLTWYILTSALNTVFATDTVQRRNL
jgi:hypothetical protein